MSRKPTIQTPPKPPPPSLSDSVLVGNVKAATMAKTVNGYAIVWLELTPDEQHALMAAGRMRVGKSQTYPEYIAPTVKSAQAALAQDVQLRKAAGRT